MYYCFFLLFQYLKMLYRAKCLENRIFSAITMLLRVLSCQMYYVVY